MPSLWNLSFKHIPLASHLGRKCGDGMFKDLDLVCLHLSPPNPATSGGYPRCLCPTSTGASVSNVNSTEAPSTVATRTTVGELPVFVHKIVPGSAPLLLWPSGPKGNTAPWGGCQNRHINMCLGNCISGFFWGIYVKFQGARVSIIHIG